MNKKIWLRRIAATFLLILAAFFGYKTYSYYHEMQSAANEFDDLSREFYKREVDKGEAEIDISQNLALKDLQDKNSDTFGWIYIEGTVIDYPVMHTPNNLEYYLYRNFNKGYSSSGTPFLDGRCSADSDNMVIYAHNIQTGTMFADLHKYKDQEFFETYDEIVITMAGETRTYKVIAVLLSEVGAKNLDFAWFNYLTFADEDDFNEFVEQIERHTLFETDLDVEYGDQFITLATCSYHSNAGRIVVIGVETERIEVPEEVEDEIEDIVEGQEAADGENQVDVDNE